MRQYCKYCANAVIWGDCHCLCEVKEKVISEASASKVNNCKDFELNEMSVFDYNQIYKPRYKHEDTRLDDGTQLGIDILAELGGKA